MPQQRDQAGPETAAPPPPGGRGRIDLSIAQVAASALATVVGAVFASELGVYGTIIGAAVVSVGATTGSALFQHLFKRTGEQLRSAVERTPAALANDFREVPAKTSPDIPTQASTQTSTQASTQTSAEISAEWNESRTLRSKRRWTWRTYTAVSALVFVLAMTPIVGFELATGQPVSATVKGESGSGTSLGGSSDSKPSTPKRVDSPGSGGTDPATVPTSTPTGRPSGTPSSTPSGTPSGTPSSTPSGTPSSTPSSTPANPPTSTPSSTPTTAGPPGATPPATSAATPSGTPSP
ncbi:hypothetical protein [Kitasatospora sp. MAP5-34]|uniref:hypothetical protein n=1 Tax=Kitasatospora sp. MAP5-34 TaxID=3035102 RepID=UPI0024754393|nr:hypothetical protein [Kitasatospora sp. MAP5-34]MDH6580190.1 cell division protein FtsN [Kitasatospora sp. MAP5-34]